MAVEEKSNEITAIPEQLELLSLNGAIVTIDAMGMQKAIVAQIRQQQADFVIGLKDDQPALAADMSQLLDEGSHTKFAELTTDVHATTEQAHCGTKQRDVRVIEIIEDSPHRQAWKDRRTLAVVMKRPERDGSGELRDAVLSEQPATRRRVAVAGDPLTVGDRELVALVDGRSSSAKTRTDC